MRAERMIKEYPNLKRELSVLEFQLSRCEGIDYDTVISSLTFSKPEGERVQTSGVSDVTARAALAYRKVADRMSDEWLSYLAGQYGQIKEELDFFEHAVRGLSGKLPEIVWDMAVERFTWEELMMKYHISHTMVAKYRKKAIKELDALYEERDRQTESFILILSRLVDTFISRISLTMLPVPNPHNTVCVLSWEEARHWQSRSSGYSSS